MGGVILTSFKTYFYSYSNQDCVNCNTAQWTRLKGPEIDPQECGQLIFNSTVKAKKKQ